MYVRQIVDYIAKKDWDRSRTALRLYMYETRKSMTRFNDKTGDTVTYKHIVYVWITRYVAASSVLCRCLGRLCWCGLLWDCIVTWGGCMAGLVACRVLVWSLACTSSDELGFACVIVGMQEAAKLYAKFKRQIEATDFALTKKDGDKADAALQGAISTFTSWLEVVGIPT